MDQIIIAAVFVGLIALIVLDIATGSDNEGE